MTPHLYPWVASHPATTPPASPATGSHAGRYLSRMVLLLVLLLSLAATAQASHFRYGSLTWRTVQSDPTQRTVEFKVSQAWRRSAFGNITVGSTLTTDLLYFGDGTSANITLAITSVDAAADNFYGEATITHTYPQAINYTAFFSSCCRLSNLANNANQNWYVSTQVNAGSGNSSPVSTMPPVVNLAIGQNAAAFQLAANDPNGQPLQYSLATSADLGGNTFTNATGLVVHPTTGAVTFNTAGAPLGRLYNAVIKVSDGQTSILVDFLINITRVSVPPVFDYSLTPSNGHVYQLAPGQPLTFGVRATDSDAGDAVRLQGIGLPPGSVMSPALPVSGNPVQSTFSWTPTINNLGTSVISFVAEDLAGVQSTSSVTIQVSTRPVFDVPPTAANNSVLHVTPGTAISQTIQASNAGAGSLVRLVGVTGLPAAATYSPALPTPAANPTSTQLSWTPTVADWGPHTATFTAANNYNDQSTHQLQYIVNSAPAFASVPSPASLHVVAGQPFRYDISLTDPDLVYGDELEIEHPTLPAWLTLTDNGDGTGTLSGTPAVTDAGLNPVTLVAADIYHHGMSYGLVTQSFGINVIPCTVQAQAQAVTVELDANGHATVQAARVDAGSTASCGIASLTVSPASFTCSSLGANTVTLTVTDTNGYSATATATVTVVDTQKPTLTLPANMRVPAPAGTCGAVVAFQLGATDNCSGTTVTSSAASGSTFPVGTTPVTVTATDAAGNTSTGTFTVTVLDVTAPAVATRNVTVTLVNGAAQVRPADVNNGTTDACGLATLSLSRQQFNCANLGANPVTLTATDVHGNVSSAPAVVTVVGSLPTPAIRVTPGSSVYTGGVASTLYLGYGPQTATLTATGGVQVAWSPAAGLSSSTVANPVFTATTPGTFTYTATVTNQYGCTATATVTLTVVDARCGNKNDKVLVCHNGHEICISANAVPAHLSGHPGDQLGSCQTQARPASGIAPATLAAQALQTDLVFEAYPNPFSASTTVHVRPATAAPAQVRVYDSMGRIVATLFNDVTEAGGDYQFTLDARTLTTGLYLCRYESEGRVVTQRLAVQK